MSIFKTIILNREIDEERKRLSERRTGFDYNDFNTLNDVMPILKLLDNVININECFNNENMFLFRST